MPTATIADATILLGRAPNHVQGKVDPKIWERHRPPRVRCCCGCFLQDGELGTRITALEQRAAGGRIAS